jgi:hypothetical protein
MAWSALASVAHFRGDFAAAHDRWLRSAETRPGSPAAVLASAALAAAYGGDQAEARELLDRAGAAVAASGCPSQAAFAAYVEGELRATTSVEEAVPYFLRATDQARWCGATFVEGVASVALASARTRTGDVAGAAEGFCYLLDSWRRSGQTTQLWTTARNAAGLLAARGRTHTAALLLVSADAQPGAAAVSPTIARHSGRVFVPLDDLVPAERVEELKAEATRLTPAGVLDLARQELADLSGTAR